MTSTVQPRVPAGVTIGGQFAAPARTESAVDLTRDADRYAGCWSVDDFTPEQRRKFAAIHRHAYDWADNAVGNLGMENSNYAEDYAVWVARRYVEYGFDDDALGAHTQLHEQWDAQRATAAALMVATSGGDQAWVARLSEGRALSSADLGKSDGATFQTFMERLAAAGITVSEVRTGDGRRGWSIARMDGDTFGRQVWVGDQTGPRIRSGEHD
ncbi:hypothetical protein [Cellulosimicrobium cellulans]|uniref:hypothetical protein n=1 Tax=Cellulosimicrobium cellulans TaxID=1710 RepID=UPI001BABB4B6|nr:hypothetical protein [Cellulosimicrobium cellulans]QUC00619.1 hypothetical protein J5A69_05140 [Cellulosimicrobium cellulans]